MRIELSCSACGGNRFSLDKAESDDCLVACEDCGHETGTLGSLKEKVARLVAGPTRTRFPEALAAE